MFDQYGYQPAPTLADAIEELRPIYKSHFEYLSNDDITNAATRILIRDGICSNSPNDVKNSLALWQLYVNNFKKKLIDLGL